MRIGVILFGCRNRSCGFRRGPYRDLWPRRVRALDAPARRTARVVIAAGRRATTVRGPTLLHWTSTGARVDTITIDGIEVWANHGVMPHEADLGQRFRVDVAIHLDLSAAIASDDLIDTVDYGALSSLIVLSFGAPRARLVEVVAGRVADAVLAHDERIAAVDVVVHKPSAPLTVPVRDVTIRLHRERAA
jgi:dihydroneopterin aldolase